MRWLRYALLAFLGVIILLAGATYWLLASESGARFALNQAQERVDGLNVTFAGGSLFDSLQLGKIRLHTESIELSADNAMIDIAFWPLLFNSTAHITALTADRLTVRTLGEASDDPIELILPQLPVTLFLDHLRIDELHINNIGASGLHAIQVRWQAQGINVARLEGQTNDLVLGLSADINTSTSGSIQRLEANLNWTYADYNGTAEVSGPPEAVHLELTTATPFSEPIRSTGVVDLTRLPDVSATLTHVEDALPVNITTTATLASNELRMDITGSVEAIPITMSLLADLASQVPTLSIESGKLDEGIQLNGFAEFGDVPQGSFELEAMFDDLSDGRVSDLHGQAQATAQFVGQAIQISLKSNEMGWAEWNVVSLDADFALNEDQDLQAKLEAASLGQETITFADLRTSLNGSLADLQYKLAWRDGQLSGTVVSDDTRMRATVAQTSYFKVNADTWRNSETLTLTRTNGAIELTPHCWTGTGRVCVEALSYKEEALELQGFIEALNLKQFDNLLPAQVIDGGDVEARWQITGTLADPTGYVAATISSSKVTAAERTTSVPAFVVDGVVTNQDWSATVTSKDSEALKLDLRIAGDDFQATSAIRGGGSLQLTDLQPFLTFVPSLGELGGYVVSDLAVGGTVQAPSLVLQGRWQDGVLALKEPAAKLINVDGRVNIDFPSEWEVALAATPSNGGTLSIEGHGQGFDTSSDARLSIAGSGITAADESWRIVAAPDLTLVLDEGEASYSGSVNVPEAKVTITTLPESVPKPSEDVRIVGRPVKQKPPPRLRGTVDLTLGDDVELNILGMSVKLSGALSAVTQDSELTALNGELKIIDGTLDANGQALKLESGSVLFSGDPDNPYIDLVATREVTSQGQTLKVGIRVQGPPDQFRTTLYSEPPMSDTRILSFLALGRDVNEAGNSSDSQALLAAAVSMGLSQTDGVVTNLRNSLGLDELGAMSDAHNDVAIVAGKRISEDLYVRYRYNALASVGALIIRYHLSDRWRLEASTEAGSSMDLLYEFSR